MGKAISLMASTALAPLRNYNIEQRAARVVSQSKPVPAPKYESDKQELERILREHPEILEETSKKDENLDDRLKKVFVNTSHLIDQKRPVNPDRPLPTSTEHVGFFELGFKETSVNEIPVGKTSLRQVVKFIGDHKMNPEEWSKENIATEYKLKLDDVNNIIEHFKLFAVHIPEKGKEKKRVLLRTDVRTDNFEEYIATIKEKTGQISPQLFAPKKKKIEEKKD